MLVLEIEALMAVVLGVQFCPVILTDHNDVVLRVLKKNAELNRGPHSVRWVCHIPLH